MTNYSVAVLKESPSDDYIFHIIIQCLTNDMLRTPAEHFFNGYISTHMLQPLTNQSILVACYIVRSGCFVLYIVNCYRYFRVFHFFLPLGSMF